jgi:hypothetical protein
MKAPAACGHLLGDVGMTLGETQSPVVDLGIWLHWMDSTATHVVPASLVCKVKHKYVLN